jgi:hypothetical protein
MFLVLCKKKGFSVLKHDKCGQAGRGNGGCAPELGTSSVAVDQDMWLVLVALATNSDDNLPFCLG